MDVDYLLIILPSIVLLGIIGLILSIWQYRNLPQKKANKKMESGYTMENIFEATNTTTISPPSFPSDEISSIKKNIPAYYAQLLVGDFIVLQLLASKERPYMGYELVQTLSSTGFHYGTMRIFHYYADPKEKKEPLFSLASMVEPGIFDLTHIGEISCPGLCLFMSTQKTKELLFTFEIMLETAYTLLQDLGGSLCDKAQQPLRLDNLPFHYSAQYPHAKTVT